MSTFVLYNPDIFEAKVADYSRNMAKNGFKTSRAVEIDGRLLLVFRDLSGNDPPFLITEEGDFILVLGALLYRGQSTPSCLPVLLENFCLRDFKWDEMVGTHTIIVFKKGVLFVLTDGLGACKTYTESSRDLVSNSFLAMCEIAEPRYFDEQACYEYVINGSVFGCRTLVEGVVALPANAVMTFDDRAEIVQLESPIVEDVPHNLETLDDFAQFHCAKLDSIFHQLAQNYGDNIRLSFSGGFDSRLMLAMLMRHGVKPDLFVYGQEKDKDVKVARHICDAEGLRLQVVDKNSFEGIELDQMPEVTEKNLFAFDGWKIENGLFDFGADRLDRLSRHQDGQVPLNGSLGEIYRNFFYMPDRNSSTGAVISTFYSRYAPGMFTSRFIESEYRVAMAAAIREAIGAEQDFLFRDQVEEIYPRFRGRFWTGRDAQVNQRFGTMFFPYLEHSAISGTSKIPIGYKELGYIQGRMIALTNDRLGSYVSDYGFALNGKRPLAYRLKYHISAQRPSYLRKISYRLQYRKNEIHLDALSDNYLYQVVSADFPIMRALFSIDDLKTERQFGLVATLEYIGERYNLRLPLQ